MESKDFIATEFFLQTLGRRLIVLFGAKPCLAVAPNRIVFTDNKQNSRQLAYHYANKYRFGRFPAQRLNYFCHPKLQTPNSKLQTPNSKPKTQNSKLKTQNCS